MMDELSPAHAGLFLSVKRKLRSPALQVKIATSGLFGENNSVPLG